jgi:hypothetical protein
MEEMKISLAIEDITTTWWRTGAGLTYQKRFAGRSLKPWGGGILS